MPVGVGEGEGEGDPTGVIEGASDGRVRKTGPGLPLDCGVGVGTGGGVAGEPVGNGVAKSCGGPTIGGGILGVGPG